MLRQKIGGVEDELPDPIRCFKIVSGNVTTVFVQIVPGFWTESRPDHARRRNSSVVLD